MTPYRGRGCSRGRCTPGGGRNLARARQGNRRAQVSARLCPLRANVSLIDQHRYTRVKASKLTHAAQIEEERVAGFARGEDTRVDRVRGHELVDEVEPSDAWVWVLLADRGISTDVLKDHEGKCILGSVK